MLNNLTFRPHFPYSLAPEDCAIETLNVEGAPGETLLASVSVSCSTPRRDLRISVVDLIGPGGTIAANRIDLYVVKVWEQSGLGVYRCQPISVPELLVKDDSVTLRDGYRRVYNNWKNYIKPRYVHDSPDVRLDGDVHTALEPGVAKQIWVRIRLDAQAASGEYSGRIAFNGAFNGESLPLHLTVLPIVLAEPEQDLMLWYKGTLDPTVLQYYVDEPEFRAQLQDIRAHGFTSISLTEYRAEFLQRALDIAHEVGFRRSVILHWPFPPGVLTLNYHGMRPILYISDEIDTRGPEYIAQHVERDTQKPPEAQTMICLRQESFYRLRLMNPEDIGHPPDLVAYFVSDNLTYFTMLSQFPQQSGGNVFYYWPCHMEKPNVNRVLMGCFLWKSRAAGAFPYCYQHPPVYPNLAYDDFDYWDVGTRGDVRPLRDHMTTYPARQGSVPTIQWEGLREGITDLKYLVTLDRELARISDVSGSESLADEIRQRRDAFLARIKFQTIQVTADMEREPYTGIRPEEYAEFRTKLGRDIAMLQSIGSQ